MEYFTLNSDLMVPVIAIGPGIATLKFKLHSGLSYWDKVKRKLQLPMYWFFKMHSYYRYSKGIRDALINGFRFIDYSAAYGNENIIGKNVRTSGIKREDFIITTRISNSAQRTHTQKEQFYRSLQQFGFENVDLLMFHWPVTDCFIETYKIMEDLHRQKLCKAIAVSNCHEHHLQEILDVATIKPVINQIEVHPLFTQKKLISFCRKENITVQAYTPIARFDDRLVRLPALNKIAVSYNKTPIQIVLRWHVQNGIIPVIRSLNSNRQKENLDIFDFKLTSEEMAIIDGFNINSRLRYDPDNCDFSIL